MLFVKLTNLCEIFCILVLQVEVLFCSFSEFPDTSISIADRPRENVFLLTPKKENKPPKKFVSPSSHIIAGHDSNTDSFSTPRKRRRKIGAKSPYHGTDTESAFSLIGSTPPASVGFLPSYSQSLSSLRMSSPLMSPTLPLTSADMRTHPSSSRVQVSPQNTHSLFAL